jgi:predicted ester cyclase
MSVEENKAVVRKYFEECWNKGDLTVMEELIGPESLAHFETGEEQHVTRDQWRDAIVRWRRGFPDIWYVVDHLVAEGDLVAANTRFTGTHRDVLQIGTWGPWAPTGKSVNAREANFFRLVGGQVVEIWIAWDTTTFARQLGVDLPQAGTP